MRKLLRTTVFILFLCIAAFAAYVVYYNAAKDDSEIVYKEVIQKELSEAGKLMVLEGSTRYKITKEETKDLFGTGIEIGNKTVAMDLQFNYGYSIDLATITVNEEDSIVLNIEGNSVKLDYLFLDVEHSIIESKASLLVKDYTQQEINDIQSSCVQSVRDELQKNNDNIIKAKSSLEKQLKLIIGKITSKPVSFKYE